MGLKEHFTFSLEHGRHLIITTLATVTLLTLVLIWANNDKDAPLLLVVFSVGTVGGLLNTYRRFNLIPSEKLLTADASTWQMTLQIYMSPLVGGLFGLVLYLAFLSGVVESQLFPKFPCAQQPYNDIREVLQKCQPALKQDAAKAMLWAFMGGFIERFVPNLLDGLARKGGGS